MKIEVNIEKKHFIVLLSAIVILAGIFTVYAFNSSGTGGVPATMGHSVDEIDWSKAISGNITSSGFCMGADCKTNWSQVNIVPSGTLCGLSIIGDFGAIDNAIQCQGVFPYDGCPSDYTKLVDGRITWDYDWLMGMPGPTVNNRGSGANLIHCVKI